MNIPLKIIDLFAGTGAFSHSFSKKGCEVVFANDYSPDSQKIYNLNCKDHKFVLGDLNDIPINEIPDTDILTAGFPCQPFSVAGKKEGFNDSRSVVFWKILSIIDKCNPKIVILENVKNLLTHDKKKTFKVIKDSLESRGYSFHYKVLNTSEITGIPQNRERIYVVSFKGIYSDTFNLNFLRIDKKPITDFLETDVNEKYYYSKSSIIYPELLKSVTKKDTCYQYRRVYVRENKSNECPTLTANMGTGGHNVPIILDPKGGIRKLTPRECFNLQGFPRDYLLPNLSDSRLYKLAGNAVTVPVIELIIDSIIHSIKNISSNVPEYIFST
jgi:DNA (cytosine-5)-methyltransferase 1